MRVLFVCLGNICRSPTAEAVARAAGVDCDSAGIAGYHVGEPPYGPMIRAASSYGMTGLRAREVAPEDFDDFDLILAMDAPVLEHLQSIDPGRRARVELFCTDGSDVPDPYYTRDFSGCLALIEREVAARF